MGFHIKYIFVALSGVFFACAACAQCCPCEAEDECNLGSSFDYEDPYTGEIHCSPCIGNCNYCYCADFTATCPPSVPPGRKCKVAERNCGEITGCTKYELCNTATGALAGYFVPQNSVCHIEGDACYENEVPCSVFDIDVAWGQWSCAKANQSEWATWDFNAEAWNTSLCTCTVTDKDIDMDIANTVTKCEKANAKYVVSDADKFKTKKLTDSVYYTLERQYCSKCYPKYLPDVENSPHDGVIIAPVNENSSSYGVRRCSIQVTAPDYAPGCTIPYPLDSATMPNTCSVACPRNMETLENGATGIDDCVPMGVTYEDSTGSFRLGPDSNLCN